ncbi:MAG: response regulator transcription factor [Cocleimonas sp.]|nr:response regulator transcription factor [Cocleimonas sp.]
MNKLQVVFADQHHASARLCAHYLHTHNIQVIQTHSLQELKALLSIRTVDILLFDLEQGDGDGISFIQSIGYQTTMGIIIFTHSLDPINKYISLETCADDYIQKPCHYREVVARIRAVYRRLQKNKPPASLSLYCEHFTMNRLLRTVTLNNGKQLKLTQYEFDVLNTLVEHKKRPLSRQQIIDMTFERFQSENITPRNIDSIIYRLRKKFSGKHSIKTVYGVGYVFQEKSSRGTGITPALLEHIVPINVQIQRLAITVTQGL